MIDNRELRIGNWVLEFDKPKKWEVFDYTIEPRFFDPIPLTPEILEKAGFELNETSGRWWSNENFEYNVIEKDGQYRLVTWMSWDKIGVWFTYLHQLQNLYWCLCGEELEINL